MTRNFQNPNAILASLPSAQNLKLLEREDWTLFRTFDGLTQKAGVSRDLLPRLVFKELADNGLDAGAMVKVGELPSGAATSLTTMAQASTAPPNTSPACSRSTVR